jgi:uncharacterized coiled-coil protein SlyX
MTESHRLEAIEIKLAHLERSLQELGETVIRQQRAVDALVARHRMMQNQLEMLESGAPGNDPVEKPPHY